MTALMNTSAPSSYRSFFSSYSESFKIIQVIRIDENKSLPSRFSVLGLTNYYFINNSERSLCIWFVCLLIYFLFLCFPCGKFKDLKNSVCDGLIIRVTLLSYLELCTFAAMQLRFLQIGSVYGATNSLLAFGFLAFLGLVLIYIPVNAIHKVNEKSADVYRILTVTQEFDFKDPRSRYYYLFYMIQRLGAALCYSLLIDYSGIQGLILSILVAVQMVYCLFFLPFKKQSDNYFVGILEFFSMFSVWTNLLFEAPGISELVKERLTWVCIVFLWLGIFFSVVKFLSVAYSANTSIFDLPNLGEGSLERGNSIDLNMNEDLPEKVKDSSIPDNNPNGDITESNQIVNLSKEEIKPQQLKIINEKDYGKGIPYFGSLKRKFTSDLK